MKNIDIEIILGSSHYLHDIAAIILRVENAGLRWTITKNSPLMPKNQKYWAQIVPRNYKSSDFSEKAFEALAETKEKSLCIAYIAYLNLKKKR